MSRNFCKTITYIVLSQLVSSFVLPVNSANASYESIFIENDKYRKITSGYALTHSIYSGEKLSLRITCPAKNFIVKAIRVGFYNGKDGKVIHQTDKIACTNQNLEVPQSWITNLSFETKNFIPGMYLMLLKDSEGYSSYIPVVIKSKNSTAKALFSIPIMTMQAYNTWTGANTYGTKGNFEKRLRIVDFRKPYDTYFGAGKYLRYVHPLVVFVEKMKLDVEYVADTDLHFEQDLLDNRKVFISAGHDEYWTLDERNRVLSARNSGTNTLFFGANAGYWITRLSKTSSDNSIRMEIYKSAKEDPNKVNPTVRFREMNMSETQLTGLEYKCFPAKGKLSIKSPNSFIFNGIKNLDLLNLKEIVGPEVDTLISNTDFSGEIINLAESRVKCGKKWYIPKYGTMNMILGYSLNGAGGLFSTGTMGWVTNGLRSSEQSDIGMVTRVVTKNILLSAIKGPLQNNQ